MFSVLGTFLQAAIGQVLVLALRLESGQFPRPLTPAQEQAAFAAFKYGDGGQAAADARDSLIRHNLRLVAHVAKKYYAAPGGQDDMVSIGTIGLIKAVDTFDPARRSKFASYASQCIENELRMSLRHRRKEAGTISLQEPLESSSNDSGLLSLADTLPDDSAMEYDLEQRDAAARLRTMLSVLTPREKELILQRYGLGRPGAAPATQQQVAKRFGISRSYVSRLEKRALEKLRTALGRR